MISKKLKQVFEIFKTFKEIIHIKYDKRRNNRVREM